MKTGSTETAQTRRQCLICSEGLLACVFFRTAAKPTVMTYTISRITVKNSWIEIQITPKSNQLVPDMVQPICAEV